MGELNSRARWWTAAAIAAVLCAAAFLFDSAAQRWIELHQAQSVVEFMRAVSRWGDWPPHVVVGMVGAAIAYAFRNQRWTRMFLAMILACALAGSAARVIKVGTGRSRPSVQTDAGWNGPRFTSKYHAFPSGHVAASTAFFGVLVFARWRAGAAFLLIPVLIGFSRMYIGAHHLSDVVCAAVLGLLSAWLASRSLLGKASTRNCAI